MSSTTHTLDELLATIRALRDPKTGCPWDIKQTHATLAQYCLEEAHEVVDAIEKDDPNGLVEELGDLLLQVILHAQLLSEKGRGSFEDVCRQLNAKMIERHPHVFAVTTHETRMTADEVIDQWNARKIAKASHTSRTPVVDKLRGIPKSMPALQRASRFGDILSSIGFDWSTPAEVWKKVEEEIEELTEAVKNKDDANIDEELGDVLFVLAQWARLSKRDPEQSLRNALTKFLGRIEFMETHAEKIFHKKLEHLSLPEMEYLWKQAKK